MPEASNVIYGRLKEAAHLSGYTFARTTEWLDMLLAGDAWQQVGEGFTDVNVFLRSIDLSPFNIGDTRPALVRRIKDLQPEASVRAIAEAVGQPKSTIQQDLKPWTPPPSAPVQDWTPEGEADHPDLPPPSAPVQDWTPEGEAGDEEADVAAPDAGSPEPKPPGAHVGKNSGDNEWYTPAEYIKAARAVMGDIDLDPASSEIANAEIGALEYFTAEDDGLSQPWSGRVWMNPPYAQPLVDEFCSRLARSYTSGEVPAACVLVNNATETKWFQSLAAVASAMCFPRGRVKFWHPSKEAVPLQGQVVVYLGPDFANFRSEFLRFGFVVTV